MSSVFSTLKLLTTLVVAPHFGHGGVPTLKGIDSGDVRPGQFDIFMPDVRVNRTGLDICPKDMLEFGFRDANPCGQDGRIFFCPDTSHSGRLPTSWRKLGSPQAFFDVVIHDLRSPVLQVRHHQIAQIDDFRLRIQL